MRKLHYYLGNPFRTKRISLISLVRFTIDLLERFKARNDHGVFDRRIEATENALSQVDSTYIADIGTLGIRKARKATKNRFRTSLMPTLETLHGKLLTAFGSGSNTLKKFFPQGRTILGRCADDVLANHLANLVEQVKVHRDQLEAGLLTEVTNLHDTWLAIHDASRESTGRKADAEAKRRDARAALEHELFLNLLKVAELHEDQPDQLGLYMQQYLLETKLTSSRNANNTESIPTTSSSSGSPSNNENETNTPIIESSCNFSLTERIEKC